MTKQEFESLVGNGYTDTEFEAIHEMYMNAGDHVSKQEFAQMYLHSGDHCLAHALNNTIALLRNMLTESANERCAYAECVKAREHRLATLLLRKSDELCDDELRHEAENLLGKWDAAMLAIELGLPLWQEELTFVNKVLARDRDRETARV